MLDLLHGIRDVSFNHFLLGPMGMQLLADLGADVIAVEPPDGAAGIVKSPDETPLAETQANSGPSA